MFKKGDKVLWGKYKAIISKKDKYTNDFWWINIGHPNFPVLANKRELKLLKENKSHPHTDLFK